MGSIGRSNILDKDGINLNKKISLLKIISITIIIYSIPFPLLALFGHTPHHPLQYVVLVIYGIVGAISFFYLKKHPKNYSAVLTVILLASILTFTFALFVAVSDEFRAMWFYLLVIVAFFAGDKKLGFKTFLLILIILFIYFFSPFNTFNIATFQSIILGFIVVTHLSYYFSSIMEDNENKILDYKNNLESMVEEKLLEIEGLNIEIISTQQEVIYTMGAIGETRSKETGLHVKRVAEYSHLFARLSGLSEEESKLLKLASPMHDIGKIGIPDNILNKPGKLTFEEFEVMKDHAIIGHDMLKHSQREIFKTASIVAIEHHEKYDGSGYPHAKQGEDIHIYGRITALADVFDALGSNRVYKKAWEDDKIFNMIKEENGKHFDPKLVNLFFENLDLFLDIRDNLRD